MTATVRDLVDELDVLDLSDLADLTSPCVSVYLPTGRTHHDAERAPLELRALVDEARRDVGDDEASEIAPVLDRVAALADEGDFWQQQSEGLAVFADAETVRTVRLSTDPGRRVSVGAAPHLVPLVDELDHHFAYYLLALSKGQVRLFGGTWTELEEMSLGPIPASLEDMERRHEKESELQHQPQPSARGTATFHGHGGRNEDEVMTGKFLSEVASGVRRRLGAASTTPLYLAAVAEHLPPLRDTGQLPQLRERMITGNPQATAPHELLESMRPILEADVRDGDADRHADLDRARSQALFTTDVSELTRAAEEGRVATLVVDPVAVDGPDDAVDRLVVAVLGQGGEVHALRSPFEDASVVGTLRY